MGHSITETCIPGVLDSCVLNGYSVDGIAELHSLRRGLLVNVSASGIACRPTQVDLIIEALEDGLNIAVLFSCTDHLGPACGDHSLLQGIGWFNTIFLRIVDLDEIASKSRS